MLVLNISPANSQTDTIAVVSYNLLWFPQKNETRLDTLNNILNYLKPDILVLNEMSRLSGADLIYYKILIKDTVRDYQMANIPSGSSKENIVFYNAKKLGLKKSTSIKSLPRTIDHYNFYTLKKDDINNDTTFLNLFTCHLKASVTSAQLRFSALKLMETYINNHPDLDNKMMAGDFNMYGSNIEPGWEVLTAVDALNFKDPIDQSGAWHANPKYAKYHTQSTRTKEFNGGANGGMDDRFDLILLDESIMDGGSGIKYMQDSYRAVGQDGLRLDKSLIDLPENKSEPKNIISSLYYMSDHLPVFLNLVVE